MTSSEVMRNGLRHDGVVKVIIALSYFAGRHQVFNCPAILARGCYAVRAAGVLRSHGWTDVGSVYCFCREPTIAACASI